MICRLRIHAAERVITLHINVRIFPALPLVDDGLVLDGGQQFAGERVQQNGGRSAIANGQPFRQNGHVVVELVVHSDAKWARRCGAIG